MHKSFIINHHGIFDFFFFFNPTLRTSTKLISVCIGCTVPLKAKTKKSHEKQWNPFVIKCIYLIHNHLTFHWSFRCGYDIYLLKTNKSDIFYWNKFLNQFDAQSIHRSVVCIADDKVHRKKPHFAVVCIQK